MNIFSQPGFVPPETYFTGDLVTASGLYKTIHPIAHPVEFGQPLKQGSRFPSCSICGANITYFLIQSAPDVETDEDFQNAAD